MSPAPDPTHRGEHYELEPLAEGVHFARARSEGTALANSGIVDLGGATIVFDTGLTLRAARELRAAALAVTGRALDLSANSHWHLDHLLGNQIFADRPIYATAPTLATLVQRRAALEQELSSEALTKDLRELESPSSTAAGTYDRQEVEIAVRITRALLEEALEIRFTPPTHGFEGKFPLPGRRRARLVTFGGGHTDSDTLLSLPEDGLLFAGDLVVEGTHPNLTSGHPEQWIEILGRIRRLRPERIVAGHGALADLETVVDLEEYLRTLLEGTAAGKAIEVPSRFAGWTGRGQFERNVEFLRARRGA